VVCADDPRSRKSSAAIGRLCISIVGPALLALLATNCIDAPPQPLDPAAP
jgi:hypothetical protein